MDDYSEEPWETTWSGPAYRLIPRQRSMSPGQDSRKAGQEMSGEESLAKYLNGKQGKGVAPKESHRPSEVATAVEATRRAFIRNIKPPLFLT